MAVLPTATEAGEMPTVDRAALIGPGVGVTGVVGAAAGARLKPSRDATVDATLASICASWLTMASCAPRVPGNWPMSESVIVACW